MRPIIIIGLDGAGFNLIELFLRGNNLPNFRKIITGGSFGQLKTTIPPLSPCAWSSFMTGKNPGKHGIYDFYYLDDNHNMKLHTSKTRNTKDLWEYLSENNYKCLVFNVPFTYPPKKINGLMVTDFTTPSTKADFTYPPQLKNEILQKYADYKISEESKYAENPRAKREFFNEVFELADIRFKVFINLMRKDRFDFSMIVFTLIDHVQHWYWKYMDKTHPKHKDDKEFRETILKAYKKADKFLGEIMQMFPNHNIIVISDHGGGPYYKDVNINNWLMQQGYLFLKHNQPIHKKITYNIEANRLISKGLNIGLWKIINRFPRVKRAIQTKTLLTYKDIDWDRTVAYSYGYYGPIYINRKIIKTEEKLRELKTDIKKKLIKIKDPHTGKPLIKKVWEKTELYSGTKLELMPDIVINMGNFAYGASSTFLFSSRNIFSEPKTFKSGDHTQNGILMVYGPDIANGKRVKNAQIYDIAPTILHIFNIPVPNDMDGKVLKEVFKENSKPARRKITFQEETKLNYEKRKPDEKHLEKKDEEKIKKRLKALGYI